METNTTQEVFYTSFSVKQTTKVILMDELVSYLWVCWLIDKIKGRENKKKQRKIFCEAAKD